MKRPPQPPIYPHGRSYLFGHQSIFLEYSNQKQIHLLVSLIAGHGLITRFHFPLIMLTCAATRDPALIQQILATEEGTSVFVRSNDLQKLFKGIFTNALYVIPTADPAEGVHRTSMRKAFGTRLVAWTEQASMRVIKDMPIVESDGDAGVVVDLYALFQKGILDFPHFNDPISFI